MKNLLKALVKSFELNVFEDLLLSFNYEFNLLAGITVILPQRTKTG